MPLLWGPDEAQLGPIRAPAGRAQADQPPQLQSSRELISPSYYFILAVHLNQWIVRLVLDLNRAQNADQQINCSYSQPHHGALATSQAPLDPRVPRRHHARIALAEARRWR